MIGRATVTVDGEVTFDVVEPATGGSFFSYGGPELLATVPLEAGVPCRILVDYPRAPHAGWRGFAMGAEPPSSGDPIADAVRLAAAADVALVVVGTNDEWETESEDRTSMDLPGRQDELVAAVAAVNPRTVVVLNCGSPVTMPWLDQVAAVLQIWFPGGQVGSALVDVLSGDVEPGGRLPVTFPRALDRTPAAPFYPGDGVRVRVRRRPSRRLSLVPPRGGRAVVPVRSRARLHDVRHRAGRTLRLAGCRCLRRGRRRQHRWATRLVGRAGLRRLRRPRSRRASDPALRRGQEGVPDAG